MTNGRKQILCLALFFVFATCLLSSPARAESPGKQFTSFMGFTIDGKATLQQVIRTLGPATIVEKGDAGEYEASICYKTDNGYVRFLSGEMGGADQELLGFGLSAQAPNDKCAPLPAPYATQPLKLGDLTLGMGRAAFVQAVGGKVEESETGLRHLYSYDVPVVSEKDAVLPAQDDATDFNDSISVEAQFANDSLNSVEVWKIDTY